MEFRTITQDGTAEQDIKKSRFICQAKRVESEEEARTFIQAVKKEHYKATHNCSAFILGEKSEIKRSSDDGEPSGTAGVPMLGVLENHDLTNVCVVVTRYFGGIKLGAGGLIRAYASSVALAIKELGIVQRKEQIGLQVELSYSQYQEYANFLKEQELEEFDTQFTDKVQTLLYLDKERIESVQDALIDFYQGKVSYQETELREVEIPQPLYQNQE
ncbi:MULTISPECIES: YigZ family protein [unclassified Streptococcus]|uniref:YigZ family protein n=1 Tax=unclassified Streptococcus TaxID=2608887 RepID=UPI001072A966|nr:MULTISPECIES: YigZ family protein [unclassified Streptococcus]MBF0805513.1 YigZ family protein [Streptococcus sp. 19428wA2_WM07]TFU28967.1 YigZ family protein [Streptococcus sp. WM07]